MDEPLSEDDENEDEEIVDELIIVKLRQLVKKIRKSSKLRQKLNKCCKTYKTEYLVPIIDVSTRWNSTYQMIRRAKKLKIALRVLCLNESKLFRYQINEGEWLLLSDIEKLLHKFDRATQLMSMERHPTICAYLPTLDWLINSVENFAAQHTGSLANAARMGLLKLKKYELDVDTAIIPFISTVLHPALKLNYYKEHGYSTSQIRAIKKAITEYFQEHYESDNSNENNTDSDDDLHAHMFKRSRIEKTSSELEKYLNLPLTHRTVQPLDYWQSQADQFHCLSRMARDFLPIQSASVSVERDFSKGTHFVTPERCSLLQATIRACMSLKSWYTHDS